MEPGSLQKAMFIWTNDNCEMDNLTLIASLSSLLNEPIIARIAHKMND